MPQLARDLREQEILTLANGDGFTLVSPYDLDRTSEFARQIESNLHAIRDVLEVELPPTILAYLEPVDIDGLQAEFSDSEVAFTGALERPNRNRVLGSAGRLRNDEGMVLVIYVPRDRVIERPGGRDVRQVFRFNHEPVIRHELAHLCAFLAGLEGPTWFDEGLALEFQSMQLIDGRLLADPVPATLLQAKELHAGFTIADLLDWEEDSEAVSHGAEDAFHEGRPLAHSLMRYLSERTAGNTLRQRFEAIHALSRAELMAHEEEWHAWLDRLPGRW